MTIKETYGNHIDFKGTCLPKREREIKLKHDKDSFVHFACRLRKNKTQIKGFDGYVNDPKLGVWTLDVHATKEYHKMLQEALKDPLPILQKWAEEDRIAREKYLAELKDKQTERETEDSSTGHES